MRNVRAASVALIGLALFGAACQATLGTAGIATESPVAVASPTPRPRFTPIPTATPEPTPARSIVPLPTATPKLDFGKPPVPATDEAGLAAQLAAVEKAIRDPNVKGNELVWYGHLQQLAYGQLADLPDLRDRVVAALPAEVRPAVLSTLDAGKQLRNMHGPIPKQLPDWKIVEPAPVETLVAFYREAEAKFGVAWYYLAAIHLVESRMGRIHGLSTAGAQGPMQFIPSTWAAYGTGDINDDHDAIMGAANYLRASGAPSDMDRALYAYNHSLGYVGAIKAYAAVMYADPDAYRGYWGWQVYYTTQDGTFYLPAGWTPDSQ